MRFAGFGVHDARAERRFKPRDRDRNALRIELVGAKKRLRFSSFFELERLQPQADDRGVKARTFEFGAQHFEERALVGRRRRERYLEIAIAGVFELDGKLQAARALAAALEIGADTREQHAQGEKDLGFVGSSPFTEDRGFDCNGLRAWNEWTPVDSARELVPARRNRAE